MWAACTVLLLAFRAGYGFPTPLLVDSWIYTSYQWDFHGQIAEFGPTYYASRLSWILPGVVLHHLFDPATANICYKLLASAATALACGHLVYRIKGLAAGLLAVGVAVLAPAMIRALQADYVDIPVLMYAVLSLACIAQATNSRRWVAWIFLAGVAFSAMAVANLSALAIPGLGIATFHLLWLRWGFKRQVLCLGLYLTSAVLVIFGLEFIWRRAGATPGFLRPQIEMIFFFGKIKGQHNPWAPVDWHWVLGATWLVLPTAALVLGLLRSTVSRSADTAVQRLTGALTAGLAVSLGTGLFLEGRNIAVLAYPFYAHAHLCLALPLLVLVGCPDVPARNPWLRPALAIAGLLLVVLAGNLLGLGLLLRSWERAVGLSEPGSAPVLLGGLLLGGATLGFFWRRPRRIPGGELLLAGLAACSFPLNFDNPGLSDHLPARYTAMHSAYRTVSREFPSGSYRFWEDGQYRDGHALAATKLWLYRLFTAKPFPEFDTPDLSGRTLIVPAAPGTGAQILARAGERLHARGLTLASPRILAVPGAEGTGFDLVCFAMQAPTMDPDDPALATTARSRLIDLRSDVTPAYISSIEKNLYGARTVDPIDLSAGYPAFTRTDARDHLATPFVSLPQPKPGVPRKLSLVIVMPAAAGDAACIVQTEAFAELGRFALNRPGRTVYSMIAPAECQQVRIYFQSGSDQAVPLPVRASLYEIDP
jgi:hypothetical protein